MNIFLKLKKNINVQIIFYFNKITLDLIFKYS